MLGKETHLAHMGTEQTGNGSNTDYQNKSGRDSNYTTKQERSWQMTGAALPRKVSFNELFHDLF